MPAPNHIVTHLVSQQNTKQCSSKWQPSSQKLRRCQRCQDCRTKISKTIRISIQRTDQC